MPKMNNEYELSVLEVVGVKSDKPNGKVSLVRDFVDDALFIRKEYYNKSGLEIYKALQTVTHNNLPKIHFLVETDDGYTVIEEYIHGFSLLKLMEKQPNGTLSEHLIVDIAVQVCDALETLHNMNPQIIHRDIKPANILYSNDGVVKLIDFDASKEQKAEKNEDTITLGTKAYAAPEQHGYAKTDCRTDIYTLGTTMFHLLTGNIYTPDGFETTDNKSKNNVYQKLSTIIKKCVEVDPKKRYADVMMLKFDLTKTKKVKTKSTIHMVVLSCIIIVLIGLNAAQFIRNTPTQTYPSEENVETIIDLPEAVALFAEEERQRRIISAEEQRLMRVVVGAPYIEAVRAVSSNIREILGVEFDIGDEAHIWRGMGFDAAIFSVELHGQPVLSGDFTLYYSNHPISQFDSDVFILTDERRIQLFIYAGTGAEWDNEEFRRAYIRFYIK
jgi:hypothetical protein